MIRIISTIIATVLSACFSPTFLEGIPCSAEGECPSTQVCAADNRCYDSDSDLNGDPTLAGLEVSLGALEPAFDPAVTSYTLALGLGAEDLSVTPTAQAAGVAIVVAETTVTSGEASPAIALNLGNNLLEVVVTAANGATTTYQITTNRGAGILQQAYAKASNTDADDQFGDSLALSGDTLAVGAIGERSADIGVGGNQNDNSAALAGAVYVFVRSGTSWAQQAYIKASNTGSDSFGTSVALSSDGDTLAVGASGEDSAGTGVGGDQNDNSAPAAGAVYVFVRNGTSWAQQAYIKSSNAEASDRFGLSLALSSDGDTLAVGAIGERSAAAGVDGDQNDNSAINAGAVYVFVRNGASWAQQAFIKASNTDGSDSF